jgi:hypothetical protein
VHLDVVPVSEVGQKQYQRDECARDREYRVHVPSASSEPSPGKTDDANDNVDNVEERQQQEDVVSSPVPAVVVWIPLQAQQKQVEHKYSGDATLPSSVLRYCSTIAPLSPSFPYLLR